jgi:GDP-L-fucose synthase
MKAHEKIFVAGHKGLVGSAIYRKLVSRGYSKLVTRTRSELDLKRQEAVERFFQKERPRHVIMAAAKVGGIWANNVYPAEFIYENLLVQANVLHAAYKAGVLKLLFLGSSCVYPRDCPQPMREEYLLSSELERTNEPYAVAKIAGLIQCEAYNRQYGTKFLAVMPTNLYGPNDNYDLNDSHVMAALIRKFHLAKLAREGDWEAIGRDERYYGKVPEDIKKTLAERKGKVVRLWGTGKPHREFLYVDDMADACLHLMNLDDDGRFESLLRSRRPFVNIGCGEDQSIRELADRVADVVGFKGEIEWDSSKPDGTPRKLLDVSLLQRTFGWRPKVPLEDGIRLAYRHYRMKSTHEP